MMYCKDIEIGLLTCLEAGFTIHLKSENTSLPLRPSTTHALAWLVQAKSLSHAARDLRINFPPSRAEMFPTGLDWCSAGPRCLHGDLFASETNIVVRNLS